MITQKIAIAGSSGRMGRTLLEAVAQAPDMQLAAACLRTHLYQLRYSYYQLFCNCFERELSVN